MKFRKINDTTVNCIITQEDLRKYGIDLDDLFDRKKKAVEFIRKIILKAASSVNLNIKNDYTSMRISVLPDRSVSLTISQDPEESAKIREHKNMTKDAIEKSEEAPEKKRAAARKTPGPGLPRDTYVFAFPSIRETSKCCRFLACFKGISTSLYFVRDTGSYYLMVGRGKKRAADYDSIVLKLNEFGKMVSCDERTLAYIREHSECVLADRAAQQISEIYS